MVSNIFYFHPYLGKIPILTNIFFQRGWFNHQADTLRIQPQKNTTKTGFPKVAGLNTPVSGLVEEATTTSLRRKTSFDAWVFVGSLQGVSHK